MSTSIPQLNTTNSLALGDYLIIYSQSNGDTVKASLASFINFLKTSYSSVTWQQQFVTPSAGVTTQIIDNGNPTWLIIQPSGGVASYSVTLPSVTNCTDGQELMLSTTQQISTFSINPNGATAIFGAPTSLGADDFLKFRFYVNTASWYRIS